MEDWKIEYCKILNKNTVSAEDYKKAISIKRPYTPPKLYKYFSCPETSLKVIESELLLLKSPNTYNDPFECYEYIDDETVIKEAIRLEMNEFINQLIEDKIFTAKQGEFLLKSQDPLGFIISSIKSKIPIATIEKKFTELNESVKKSFEHKIDTFQSMTKMSCFSEKNDNLLMWGHYSKNHEGVCIEFDTADWKENRIIEQLLFPVLYTETLFNATQHIINSYRGEFANNRYNRISWISKSIDWQYEKEWRIIMVNDVYQNGYMLPVKNISAVYLGAKIAESLKYKLIQGCSKKKIPVYSGSISRKQYRIEFEQLNVA